MLDHRISKFTLFSFTGSLALICAAAFPAAAFSSSQAATAKPHAGTPAAHTAAPSAQPGVPAGTFTVSQLGHPVGTADFRLAPAVQGIDSTATVKVAMQGLDYALSKTEQLDHAHHLEHLTLSATVNGSAVHVTAKPDGGQILLNISANGRNTTTRLGGHNAAVFLPDFDPGALQILLTLAAAQNNRDVWAILPKQAGTIEPVQLATYADEHGTLSGNPITVHHLIATIGSGKTDLFSGPDNQLLQAELPQQGFSLVRKGFMLKPPSRPIAPPTQ